MSHVLVPFCGRVKAAGAPSPQYSSLPLDAASADCSAKKRHPKEGHRPEQHRLFHCRAHEFIHDALLGLQYGHTNT